MTDGEARGQCPLCGTTECLEVREASDPRFGLPGRFKVLWCPKCDIGSTHPRLTWTELQRYYPDAYDPYRGHTWLSEISRVHRFLIAAEDRFGAAATDRVRPGTLLDVGCGNGAYMAEMAQRGFTVTGVEISPLASKVVTKRGFPVVSGDFLTATLPREAFDVVTMNHYLEHCLDPRANLKKAHELLKEGGHLIVGVPNFSSWPSRHFGSHWSDLELPRHTFHFGQAGLVRLLEACEFRIQNIRHVATADAGSIATSLLVKSGKRTDTFVQRLYPFLHVVFYPLGIPLSLLRESAWIRVLSEKTKA